MQTHDSTSVERPHTFHYRAELQAQHLWCWGLRWRKGQCPGAQVAQGGGHAETSSECQSTAVGCQSRANSDLQILLLWLCLWSTWGPVWAAMFQVFASSGQRSMDFSPGWGPGSSSSCLLPTPCWSLLAPSLHNMAQQPRQCTPLGGCGVNPTVETI